MNSVLRNIIEPVSRRLGTAVSGALIGYGVAADEANLIGSALVVVVGIGSDLLLSYFDRKAR